VPIKENKMVKARFEYENGLVKEATGEELEKWLEDLNSVSLFASNYGIKFRNTNWNYSEINNK